MHVDSTLLAYFSPTNTTKKILEKISEGVGSSKVEVVDLTRPEMVDATSSQLKQSGGKEEEKQLVILGAPVYGGRIASEALSRLKHLKGNNRLAAVVVVYGNRAYEDALLELKDLATELGFKPVAGAAFIGEHSFSSKSTPIAVGRPDEADLVNAWEFGKSLSRIVGSVSQISQIDQIVDQLKIPGNFPYKERHASPPISPVTKEDLCIKCGVCAEVCPTQAITMEETILTNVQACLRCCACIKNCPTDARVMEHPKMVEIAQWLNSNCSQRREPEIYSGEAQ